MFDVRCSMFDVRCSMFDVRCSMFDVRCSMFDFRFSIFDFRFSIFDFRPTVINNNLLILALCGNGSCDVDIGENCVTCPLDCHGVTCGKSTLICYTYSSFFFVGLCFVFLTVLKMCVETDIVTIPLKIAKTVSRIAIQHVV
jgi:hypothetical protein